MINKRIYMTYNTSCHISVHRGILKPILSGLSSLTYRLKKYESFTSIVRSLKLKFLETEGFISSKRPSLYARYR